MKLRIPALSLASSLLASACIVPPAMLERAGYGPPQEYWQGQGRYRQTPPDDAERPVPPAAQPVSTDPAREGPTSPDPASARTGAAATPLLAWDGGVVDGAPQGAVTEREGAPRGLEPAPAGRMHIIELYQQVLDERDALAQELELVRKSLEQTSLALAAKTTEADQLTTRVAALESSHEELRKENHAIAARLLTAQIRRLEAEKLLLETRIQIEEARAGEAGQTPLPQARDTGSRINSGAKNGGARPGKPEQAQVERAGGHE